MKGTMEEWEGLAPIALSEAIDVLKDFDTENVEDRQVGLFLDVDMKRAVPVVISAAEKWAAQEWWDMLSDAEKIEWMEAFLPTHGTLAGLSLYAYRAAQEGEKHE